MESSAVESDTVLELSELLKSYEIMCDLPTFGHVISCYLANENNMGKITHILLPKLNAFQQTSPWDQRSLRLKILSICTAYKKLIQHKRSNWQKIVSFLGKEIKAPIKRPKNVQMNSEIDIAKQTVETSLQRICHNCQKKSEAFEELSLENKRLKAQIKEFRKQHITNIFSKNIKQLSARLIQEELKNSTLKLKLWKMKRNLPGDQNILPFQAAAIELLKKRLHAMKKQSQRDRKKMETLKSVISTLNYQIVDIKMKNSGF